MREVMDIRECALYLGIATDTLYKYASTGLIPSFKLGNRWKFKKSKVDEWMEAECAKSSPREVGNGNTNRD